MSIPQQTILVNNGQQAIVPPEMMPEVTDYTLQNPEQFEILWGKITKTIPELSSAVHAVDPIPDRVPDAVLHELVRANLNKDVKDIKDVKTKLLKTEENDLKLLVDRIKNDSEIPADRKDEGIKYTEGVMTVVSMKNEMVKCEKACTDIVNYPNKVVTEQMLREIIQQACSVAYRFISMGVRFKAELMVELQSQATQLGVITDEVKSLSGQVLQNSQWLGNGIRGLHAHQEQMGFQTFQSFQKLFYGLDANFKQNLNELNQIKSLVSSTKEEQAAVKQQLIDLKGQANQLVLQKNEQVGQLTGILDELKVRTEEVSKAVANGTELRAGMVDNIKQYLEHSRTLQDRCNELAEQRSALETAVLSLQDVAGFFDEHIKARADEISQLSQNFAQGNEELKKIGNTGLNDLAKVLGGVARLEQAVADQKQTGAETKTLVANLSKAIKDADLGRVAGLMAAQNQDRPDLNSMIPLIQQAVENGLKMIPEEAKEPVMTQQQAMDFIKTVASWYETRANGQASALTVQLAEFGKILEQVRTEIAQNGNQRGLQGFNMPITIVQQVADGLNNLKPIAVQPVVDYGRIQFMTPADRIREFKSLAAQPQWRTKTRTGHGMVPLKSKLVDPALDKGRDVRRTTKARRVARVKKIERRRIRDPLDVFLQGTYK